MTRMTDPQRQTLLDAVRDSGHVLTPGNVVATERELRKAVDAIIGEYIGIIDELESQLAAARSALAACREVREARR